MKKKSKSTEMGLSNAMMVDVLFILLIFFLLISNIKTSKLQVKATKVNKTSTSKIEKKTKKYVVGINKQNQFYIHDKQVDLRELLKALHAIKQQTPKDIVPVIVIRPDSDCSASKFVELLGALQEAGLQDNVHCEVGTK